MPLPCRAARPGCPDGPQLLLTLLGVDAKVGRGNWIVPDTISLIIWLIAGITGGFVVGDFLKGRLDPARNAVVGAVGGVIGAQILQLVIPALRGFDTVSIVGQAIGAAASGVASTIVAGAVIGQRGRRRGGSSSK